MPRSVKPFTTAGEALERAVARPNVHAENVLAAARRYGDARVAHDRVLRDWQRGEPMEPMRETSATARAAEHDLTSAARAYATRMRRKAGASREAPTAEGRPS